MTGSPVTPIRVSSLAIGALLTGVGVLLSPPPPPPAMRPNKPSPAIAGIHQGKATAAAA